MSLDCIPVSSSRLARFADGGIIDEEGLERFK